MMSRMLRKPIHFMTQKVNDALDQTNSDDSMMPDDTMEFGSNLKYMIYSAHDTQVTAMMVFLTQSIDSFDYTPYSSNVIFELKYSESCLQEEPSSDCFGVSM